MNTFNFIIYSTQTTYLYDIRNSSLPVSEMPLNINFKGIELKNFLKSGINLQENHLNFSSNDYIGIDKSRKDFSVIHFSQKEELESKHLFKNFMDITLINTDSEIHDSCAFSFKDNFYIFTVDEYGGLNYHIYEKNKSNKICQNNENIEMNTNIEEIRVLFEENNVKRLFNIKEDHSKKINVCYENKNLSDNDLDNSDLDLNIFYNEENGSEDEEIKLNFGNLKINGNDKKVYEIVNKRSILKKLINNNNSEIEMTNQSKIPNEKLKYLEENFKSIEFDKISQLNSLLNKYK